LRNVLRGRGGVGELSLYRLARRRTPSERGSAVQWRLRSRRAVHENRVARRASDISGCGWRSDTAGEDYRRARDGKAVERAPTRASVGADVEDTDVEPSDTVALPPGECGQPEQVQHNHVRDRSAAQRS
jgi:hypothetical protein